MKLVAILVALMAGGCSWLMVAGPPQTPVAAVGPPSEVASIRSPVGCTRQKFAPIVDTVFATLFGVGAAITAPVGVVVLATAGNDDYNQGFGVILLGASLVYAAMATPFVLSARSGYRDVTACREAYVRAFGSSDFPGYSRSDLVRLRGANLRDRNWKAELPGSSP